MLLLSLLHFPGGHCQLDSSLGPLHQLLLIRLRTICLERSLRLLSGQRLVIVHLLYSLLLLLDVCHFRHEDRLPYLFSLLRDLVGVLLVVEVLLLLSPVH